MRKARNLIGVAGAMSLALGLGCSNGASSPPSAASDGPPLPAASEPNSPAATPPSGERSAAAGSAAPSVTEPKRPAKSEPSAQATPPNETRTPASPEPRSGLPVGPGLPKQPEQPSFPQEIPIDTRAVVQSTSAPPISGGTLAVTADDRYAIVSDPDRDRVSVVDLWLQRATAIALEPGDEPGRIALDRAGRAHVALRRGGAVVSIDIGARQVLERRAVCATPRGIAHDAKSKTVAVACASGELVTLPETGTASIDKKQLGSDLRDVLPRSTGTFVTRLKTAELVSLDASAVPVAAAQPVRRQQFFSDTDGAQVIDTLSPLGARRTIDTGDGFVMLHAGARNGNIPIKPSQSGLGSGSPYGGAGSCNGVIGNAVTTFDKNGKVVSTMGVMGTLAVDIAYTTATREFAIALAGSGDPNQPLANGFNGMQNVPPTTDEAGNLLVSTIVRFDPRLVEEIKASDPTFQGCMPISSVVGLPSPATAVAYLGDGRLLAQTREPAAVHLIPRLDDPFGQTITKIDLGGTSVIDTGHELFHRDAGAGVACASCHIEGGDDGHVWNFVELGARRTQSIHVGLEGTEPFHWIGDMRDLPTLMEHVFVGRMGGVHQSSERLNALAKWMFAVKAPAPIRPTADVAVERGKTLFHGEAECGKCHNGPKLTNNETVDVGTGLKLQVPSLVAVGYRGPWIHNGCAKTLRDRFDLPCGGATHGKTAQLASAQIDDLVAYLESL